MTSGKSICQQLSTSLVVAIGIALVWGILAVWGWSVGETILWPTNRILESIVVTTEGTHLISTQAWDADHRYNRTYRTVDGQPTMVRRGELRQQSMLAEPATRPGIWVAPLAWRERVVGISDFGRPSVGWYTIRDGEPIGNAYLVGYDLKSKQLVGYIGRNGFCSSLPSAKDQFETNNSPFSGFGDNMCSTGYLSFGNVALDYDYILEVEEEDYPQWLLFLIDADQLQEVDLRTRKVQTLFQSPGLRGVSFLTVNEDAPEEGKKRTLRRLMLRLTDRIVVLDRLTGDEKEYALAERMQKQRLAAYSLDDGQLLLISQTYGEGTEGRNRVEMRWFSPDGRVLREEKHSLTWGRRSLSKRAQATMAGLVAPIPFAWIGGGSLIAPLVMMQEHDVPNYMTGLRKAISEGWPVLVISILLAFVSAGATLRLHRKYYRPRPALWWLFVFLLGPAGLLAYWLEHRRAVLERCAACGRMVPRDRDGCAACGEAFAPPALIGTEVFA